MADPLQTLALRIHRNTLPKFIAFTLVIPDFYRTFQRFTGFFFLPSFDGFHLILLGFTWFYWVLPGFTGFYIDLLNLTNNFRVSLVLTGLS